MQDGRHPAPGRVGGKPEIRNPKIHLQYSKSDLSSVGRNRIKMCERDARTPPMPTRCRFEV